MSSGVTIRHNFETAHRLPHLPGKCESLHGHSWWLEATITAPTPDPRGIVVEYGALKREVRTWVDEHLDHGVMLGGNDKLVDVLNEHNPSTKLFVFDPDTSPTTGLAWPTVESVAIMLGRVINVLTLRMLSDDDERWISTPNTPQCTTVTVHETHVNAATWTTVPTGGFGL